MRPLGELLAAGVERLLVVTGAGVSLASGIATFRGSDAGAVWANDVTELGTARYFWEDPAGSWSWYLKRFATLEGKRPNPAHHALVVLERWQRAHGRGFVLCTQNIDCLHEQAGSQELLKVHGSSDRVRCAAEGCELGAPSGSLRRSEVDFSGFLADPRRETVPTCPACGELLRPHVLWFDEYYNGHADYAFARMRREADAATAVVFVGTSFAVGITELVTEAALRAQAPVYSVDPSGRVPDARVAAIVEPAERFLPALVSALGA